MTQLMLKINPSYIRRAPYVPAATLYPPIRANDLGMDLEKHVTALVYPQVSSYVGGDIVAGVMGSGMYRSDELTLFIDIGTNAEVVVGLGPNHENVPSHLDLSVHLSAPRFKFILL